MKRREFIALSASALCVGPGFLEAASRVVVATSTVPVDSLRAIAAQIRHGKITAREHAERFLQRAAELGWLHGFISLDAAQVLADARRTQRLRHAGTLSLPGVLLGVKDNIATRALPTSAGTPALERFHPAQDAVVVQRCLNAGAILAGKTALHELAFGGTSNNGYFGAVQNPWRRGFIPGGSSGGSAAVVAAGLVPAALGTDTLGSLRMPASLCGVVGFRPTPGRYPTAGLIPLAPTLDTAGPIARNVADVALLDDVLRGAPPRPLPATARNLRVGLLEEAFRNLDPATAGVMDRALARLRELGGEPVRVRAGDLWSAANDVATTILSYEMISGLRDYLAAQPQPLRIEDLVSRIYREDIRAFWSEQLGRHRELEAGYLRTVNDDRRSVVTGLTALLADAGVDVLAYPTTPLPARPIRENDTVELNGETLPALLTYPRNTILASVAGVPAVSVCAGLTADGLPVGIEFIAAPAADRRLLAFAARFEAARGPLGAAPVL